MHVTYVTKVLVLQQREIMDRSWMQASRISEEYENGVEQFLQFTELNVSSLWEKYFCPCVKCANGRHQPISEIRSHLICHGIIKTYTKWIWHGEFPEKPPSVADTQTVDVDMGNCIEEMIHDLGQEGFSRAHALFYDKLENDFKLPLYPRCTGFTRLSTVLALVNLKTRFG